MTKKSTSEAVPQKSSPRKAAKPATLSDVARLAGVVPMTVSRAINRSGYVSDEVRERVMKAVDELGYRPNILARQLKGQRLNAVGVLLPDIANPFANELLNGIKEVLDAAGYTAFITTSGGSAENENAALQSFVDHRIDGLLIATPGSAAEDAALAKIAAQHVPIVTVGRPVAIEGVDCVSVDHYRGAFEAVTHLVGCGHERIGYIGIGHPEHPEPLRYQGYKAALAEAGISFSDMYAVRAVEDAAFATEEDGYQGMLELAKLAEPPTAVFARNDFAAIGALRAAHMLGLKIPGDIAIAGFDNIRMTVYTTPPLTTIEQPTAEQGRVAAEFLLDRIEGRVKGASRSVVMECRLVVRESARKT